MTLDRRLIAMAFCAATCAAPAASPSVAFFSSGDRLPGVITEIKDAMARFESPALVNPATVNLSKLLELRSQPAIPEIKADCEAVVTLTNGNVLRGELGALDDESITLDTWYAGRLTLRRTMVESLRIIDRSLSTYSGPRGADGWILSGDKDNPPWRFEGSTMISQAPGSTARKLDLPDRVAVSFDLAWQSTLRFSLLIFSDVVENDRASNCYQLNFNRSYAQFSKSSASGPRQMIGSTSVRAFLEKEKVRVEFFADRTDHNFVLVVDGKRLATWSDANPAGDIKGDGVLFCAQTSSPIRISRIDIREWDGRIEDANNSGVEKGNEASVPPGSQRIRLRNGDVVTGKVVGVEDEHVAIDTPHGAINLPISRMAQVMLHRENEKNTVLCHPPKKEKGDVKAWFPEGGNIVFRLDNIEDNQFTGFSQIFGTAHFRRDAFSRVEFNIYKDELEPLRPPVD